MSPTSKYSPITARKALLDACKRTKIGSRYVEVPANVLSECVILFSSLEAQLAEATARATKAETRLSEAQAELAEQEAEKLALIRAAQPLAFPANEPAASYEQYFCQAGDDVCLLMWLSRWDAFEEVGTETGTWAEWDGDTYIPAQHAVSAFWPHPKATPTPPPSSPAAAGPGEAGWFSPLAFDSAAEYDASVADVCRRIESGEVKAIEREQDEPIQVGPLVKLTAIIIAAETPGMFIGFVKEIGGVVTQESSRSACLHCLRDIAAEFIPACKPQELRNASEQQGISAFCAAPLPAFKIEYSAALSLEYSRRMEAVRKQAAAPTTTGEGKEGVQS